MRKSGFLLALMATALVACGGSDPDDAAFQPPPTTGGGGPVAPTVSSITLVTSSPTIPSDGSAPAEITAFVRNASNQFMADVPVTFSADGGGLQVSQATTDANGIARATLSALNDPALRTLTVTATAGGATATVAVAVAGTQLTLQGSTSLALQQQGNYTVQLSDASGDGLAGRSVALTSARANTLSASSVTTDANGNATFRLTVVNSGNDTITATALGATAALAVTVNADNFAFSSPAASPVTEVALGAAQPLTVRWTSSGAPVAGQTINFSTTRGAVTPTSGVTNGSGEVTVSISATNAGGAVVTATSGANTAQVPLEFVATTPATIDVQPSLFSLGPNQTSTIIAVVRDAQGNLVKNRDVDFTLEDVTGGTLSVGTARTDSQGRAQTIYTASNQTSANEGVTITAQVQGITPAITGSVSLTVARREVFISLGTGNEVEDDTSVYRIEYVVLVTDSNGNGVANVPVSMRILSTDYYKGGRVAAVAPATGWTTVTTAQCVDEDVNRNGTLDTGEDNNGSTRLEAGNIAAVTPAGNTDADGMVRVTVSYPQEYAYYVDVELSASTRVQGTEYVRSLNFTLPGAAPDFANVQSSPPGPESPFGTGGSCNDTL